MLARKDDLMYDKNNLKETIRYCRTHNGVLQARDELEVEEKFWKQVLKITGGMQTENLLPREGMIEPIYNAWLIIDAAPKGHYLIENDDSKGCSHMINFFVRLGRKPVLEVVPKI